MAKKQIEATVFEEFVSIMGTNEGVAMLVLKAKGEEFALALPEKEMEGLVAAAAGFLNRATIGEPAEVYAMPTSYYLVGRAEDGSIVLSLTTTDGALRRFILPPLIANGILEAIQASGGAAATLPGLPSGRRPN